MAGERHSVGTDDGSVDIEGHQSESTSCSYPGRFDELLDGLVGRAGSCSPVGRLTELELGRLRSKDRGVPQRLLAARVGHGESNEMNDRSCRADPSDESDGVSPHAELRTREVAPARMGPHTAGLRVDHPQNGGRRTVHIRCRTSRPNNRIAQVHDPAVRFDVTALARQGHDNVVRQPKQLRRIVERPRHTRSQQLAVSDLRTISGKNHGVVTDHSSNR